MVNKKVKGIFFFKLLLIIIFSCESTNEIKLVKSLEEAYSSRSQSDLFIYLSSWAEESIPISEKEYEEIKNEEKAIYDIYKVFYNPLKLTQYSTSGELASYWDSTYFDVNYYVIQNKIEYIFNGSYVSHRIEDFRPKIDLDKPAICLTSKHVEELNMFLDKEKYSEDIQERHIFLDQQFRISSRGWGRGWDYNSHPEVLGIFINSTLDSATVKFRLWHRGAEAKLTKVNDKWKMYESKLTWIE